MDSADFSAALEAVPASRWSEPIRFAGRALARPRQIGAVLPSGIHLARTMARAASGQVLVELGPGSGSITRHLLARLPESGRLLALELDPSLAGRLGRQVRDPRLVIRHGDATDLRAWLEILAWPRPDAIVSGLPFQSLPASSRNRILAEARNALSPTGRFVAFQYGLRLLPAFRQHFRRIHVVGPIWRNLPPAYVILGLP